MRGDQTAPGDVLRPPGRYSPYQAVRACAWPPVIPLRANGRRRPTDRCASQAHGPILTPHQPVDSGQRPTLPPPFKDTIASQARQAARRSRDSSTRERVVKARLGPPPLARHEAACARLFQPRLHRLPRKLAGPGRSARAFADGQSPTGGHRLNTCWGTRMLPMSPGPSRSSRAVSQTCRTTAAPRAPPARLSGLRASRTIDCPKDVRPASRCSGELASLRLVSCPGHCCGPLACARRPP